MAREEVSKRSLSVPSSGANVIHSAAFANVTRQNCRRINQLRAVSGYSAQ